MKRFEAGNMLMVGASLIVALHAGLFGVWISALGSQLYGIAEGIAIFGMIFISLNTAFWVMARMKFQREIIKSNEKPFDFMMSVGMVLPFVLIFVGWLLSCLINLEKIH